MKHITTVCFAFAAALSLTQAALAQSQANPIVSAEKSIYGMSKDFLLRSAEKMPEENYAFKPVPVVMSFGQLIGHAAASQYEFCAPVLGEKAPEAAKEKKTSKADLIAQLKAAFAYCDKVYGGMTDANITATSKFFGGERSNLWILSLNNTHNFEHYGNIITYLRMKGLVPPSSEPRK